VVHKSLSLSLSCVYERESCHQNFFPPFLLTLLSSPSRVFD
jgi:hypothetical protein